jgi:hypothetical protein
LLESTSPKEILPVVKPTHVPDFGAANHNSALSPEPSDASINPTDGLTDRDMLWLKARPRTPIEMDVNVSVAKVLLKSKLTVPLNEARGPEMLPKLPDSVEVST